MVLTDDKAGNVTLDEFQRNLQSELDETNRALREVTLMLEQSQGEANKLTQRNAAITAHLQQVQGQLGTMPIQDVKMAYDSALDAQQRLFVMRGQMDKLQNDQSHLQRFKSLLERMRDVLGQGGSGSGKVGSSTPPGVEMLINAQESERQRLSRQMHDGPAQALSNFILQTEIAMRLLDVDAGQAREELASLRAAAMSTFQKVRNFIFELRPMMLDDLGLIPTIKRYADNFKDQTGMDVMVNVSGAERRVESYIEVMVFRALQELLGNAARHSQASLVKVHTDLSDANIKVTVDDNGKGFDPEIIQEGTSLGLKVIKDRVEMLGGSFEIDSVVGKGTRITFTVPVHAV